MQIYIAQCSLESRKDCKVCKFRFKSNVNMETLIQVYFYKFLLNEPQLLERTTKYRIVLDIVNIKTNIS